MLIALWITTALAALVFTAAGVVKATQPKDALHARGMTYVEDFSATQVRLIGIAEVLGGLGVILPLATGILPVLAPIAATCLAIIMIGAVVVHVRRKEGFVPSLVLTLLAATVAVLGFLHVFGG